MTFTTTANQGKLIQGRDSMAGSDLTGIYLVIVKVFIGKFAVRVTDKSVFAHERRVEFNLDLDVVGDSQQRCVELIDQHLARLIYGVNVSIVSIADIGELFHQVIVVVACTKAQGRQCNA